MERACGLIQNLQIAVAVVLVVACLAGLPFGVKPYVVASGSMEPSVHVGALAYVDRNIERESITPGDILTFKIENNAVVSHRVTENNPESKLISTKGDANDRPDPSPVRYENVVGEMIFSVPFLGYVFAFLQGNWLLVAAAVGLLNVVLALLSQIADQKSEKESGCEWTQQQEETRNA